MLHVQDLPQSLLETNFWVSKPRLVSVDLANLFEYVSPKNYVKIVTYLSNVGTLYTYKLFLELKNITSLR